MRIEVALTVGSLTGTLALEVDARGIHLTWSAFDARESFLRPLQRPIPERRPA